MKVAGREVLASFCKKHSDTEDWIANWLADVESTVWAMPRAIKQRYASASFLAGNRVIFNVKGNAYRLEAIVAYRTSTIVVTWAGTHSEYNQRNKQP